MTKRHYIQVVHKSAMFGDKTYNVSYDVGKDVWIGGSTSGTGETFQQATLSDLLCRIGMDIEARISEELRPSSMRAKLKETIADLDGTEGMASHVETLQTILTMLESYDAIDGRDLLSAEQKEKILTRGLGGKHDRGLSESS